MKSGQNPDFFPCLHRICSRQLSNMKNKIKTRKTVVKRFTKTGTGKLMRNKTGLNHLMGKKDGNRKRNLLNDGELYKGDKKRITRMLAQGL